MKFIARYADGKVVKVGDTIDIGAGFRKAKVLEIYSPTHEVSVFHSMNKGCVELSPNTIEELPLGVDFFLVHRELRQVDE